MNIYDRIREIIRGPKKIDVAIIWDEQRVMWLAQATSLTGYSGQEGTVPPSKAYRQGGADQLGGGDRALK